MLDLEGKILSANEYATRFIGRPLTGVRFNDVIVDFSSAFDLLTAVKGPPEEQMITVCDGSGTPETFYFTFKQIKDKVLAFGRMDADELDTMRKEVLDLNREQNNLVRELHKTNARLTQKKKDLAQSLGDLKAAQAKLIESEKMASLGRLVAGFAHEVNTPVGIALTASSSILESSDQIDRMLMQDEVEEDDLISALETIRDASKLVFSNLNRSADLVGSFKRTSIDQSFDNLSVYCLNDTIDDVLTTMGIKIKKASVKAVLNSRETINLYGNPGDIFQVISNLFENSLLHGFENGRLKGKILIDIRKKGKEVLIRYSDTGKGMSGETLGRIFEPFYTTLRARGGTGLGMYICHNIVTARLNGTIECSSKQGEGTRFLITIPITRVKKHETDPV
ncbi:MAG: HAMP domain-containing histidine kinase [Desulfobacterales bacterium]|nr:HAMP domain-containing histidine kinase [Desulfobacterales bacterium]